MQVLIVTAAYPSVNKPFNGTFIKDQVGSLINAGVDIDIYAFDGNGSARNYLKAGLTIRRILKNKSYDLIHAHYGLTGAAALFQTKCPVVITFHGSDLLGEVGKGAKYTRAGKFKTIISHGAALAAKQRIVVADILKTKLWPMSALTIPMGVDLSLFKPMPRYEARDLLGFSHNKNIVLFVANPNNHTKRFDIAQEAVRLLRDSIFDVELLPLYNLPHDQVPLYMNACDVLVLTSMHEASPCVIKEAIACNLPIVSVKVGDVAERINGVPGCFMCERTPEDVAAKLRIVISSGLRPDIRSNIFELSLEKIANQVLEVYDQVV